MDAFGRELRKEENQLFLSGREKRETGNLFSKMYSGRKRGKYQKKR